MQRKFTILNTPISRRRYVKKKTTKEVACQTDPEMSPAIQNKSSSTVQGNVDTPPKQIIFAPSKPQVPPKPRESCSQTAREKYSETAREKP
jgi:hypothetical protein